MVIKCEDQELSEKILDMLKTVYDPEIPVDIYELGLIYELKVDGDNNLDVIMTLTAPNCPASDMIVSDIEARVGSIEVLKLVNVHIVFDPPWEQEMMSEVAKLQLGFM
jgi:FeS assembly SUF system protein